MINLVYKMMTAGITCNENRHPQTVMKELGIEYKAAVPQSIVDSWWFWNCRGIPEKLPEYLSEFYLDPDHEHSCLSDSQKIRVKSEWTENT